MTIGEQLWLRRKRELRTLREQALLDGIGHVTYWRYERDLLPPTGKLKYVFATPNDLSEQLRLARRRAGLSLKQLALRLNVSRVTALAWEANGRAELRTFWRGRGFTFAPAFPKKGAGQGLASYWNDGSTSTVPAALRRRKGLSMSSQVSYCL